MKEYKFTKKDRKGVLKNCGYIQRFDSDETESGRNSLYFYGDICSETWGIYQDWYPEAKAPQDVSDFLNGIENGTAPLDIYVNSGGGDVFGGIAIYNILKRYKGEKTAYIDGIAASIAGIIPFSCDKVIAPKSAQLMLHKPWGYCMGNADDMKKYIESLNACEQSIIDIYAENTVNGTTAEKIKSMIDRETWLTCGEASKYFRIEISDSEAVAACASDYFGRYKNIPENLIKIAPKNSEQKRKLQLELELLKL